MSEPMYETLWPLGKLAYEILEPAQRVSDLSGITICELYDGLFRGDEIFPLVRDLLQKRYPGVKIVEYPMFGNIHGHEETKVLEALPELLHHHGCNAVITGVAG